MQSLARVPSKLLVLIILALLVVLSIVRGLQFAPNADGFYCLSFVNDLLYGQTPFHWMSPGANYLFPDMLIVFLGRILGFDGQNNFVFFTVVFILLLVPSLALLLRACRLDWNAALFGALIATIPFGFSGAEFSYVIAFPGIHEGVLPIVAASFAIIAILVDRAMQTGAASTGLLIGLCALIALGTASDAIGYVQLVAPALIGLGAVLWRFPDDRLKHVAYRVAAVVVCGAIFGLILWKLANTGPLMHQPSLLSLKSIRNVPAALMTFPSSLAHMPRLMGQTQFWLMITGITLSCIVVFASIGFAPKRFREFCERLGIDTPSQLFCLSAVASCILLSLAGPLLAGTIADVAVFRQQLPAQIFGTLLTVWLALACISRMRFADRKISRLALAGGASVFLLLVPFAQSTYALIKVGAFPQPYLATYKSVEHRLQSDGLNFVLSGYWDTKPLIEASDWTLNVCPITPDLAPFPWIMNIEWCAKLYREWSIKKAPLVVLLTKQERRKFFEENGMPMKVLQFPELMSPQAAVYDWSSQLDAKLKAKVCDAMAGYAGAKRPRFCERSS